MRKRISTILLLITIVLSICSCGSEIDYTGRSIDSLVPALVTHTDGTYAATEYPWGHPKSDVIADLERREIAFEDAQNDMVGYRYYGTYREVIGYYAQKAYTFHENKLVGIYHSIRPEDPADLSEFARAFRLQAEEVLPDTVHGSLEEFAATTGSVTWYGSDGSMARMAYAQDVESNERVILVSVGMGPPENEAPVPT